MIKSYIKSKSFYIPVGIWLAFTIAIVTAFSVGTRKYESIVPALIIWDGTHYFSIASEGYETFPCDWSPESVCGNVGWFPFYPMLAKLLGYVGVDHRYGLLGLSWFSLLAAMLLLFKMVKGRLGERSALFTLLVLVTFPSSFYFYTAFPYSVYLLLAVVLLFLLESSRNWLMIPLSGFLAVTYPSGAVIGLPFLYTLIREYKSLSKQTRTILIASMAAIGVAIFLFFTYFWVEFGDFFLYTKIQSQYYYAHSLSFPLVVYYNVLVTMSISNPIFISVVLVLITLPLMYNRKLPASWQLFMWAALLFTPTLGTCDCYYRHIIIAFPMFVMIGSAIESKWRRYLLGGYFAVSLWLGWTVFLHYYRLGQLM